jgi:hypothetical protein
LYCAGLLRQPKWGHLKDVHKAVKLCEKALVATDPTVTSLGTNLEVLLVMINLHLLQLLEKTSSTLCFNPIPNYSAIIIIIITQ